MNNSVLVVSERNSMQCLRGKNIAKCIIQTKILLAMLVLQITNTDFFIYTELYKLYV